MQMLPIICVIVLTASVTIAVLLWRIKPLPKVDTEIFEKRISEENQKIQSLQVKLETCQADLRSAEANVAAAEATKEATMTRAERAEQGFQNLNQKHDELHGEYKRAVEQASASKTDADNMRMRMGEMGRAIESLTMELNAAKEKLVEAVAKHQSDEAAARHFENISQTILKETLEEAKRGVGELSATFQKSSGVELEKHADKVARTLEPLQVKLKAYDEAIESLKKGTQENYGSLKDQLSELQKTERSLHDQAKALTTALSASPE